MYFALTKADTYQNTQHAALKKEAANLGYTIKFIESNFSASEQSQQIQQYIASGEHPKAFLLWALDPKAGIAQAAQLEQIAPVFAMNQAVAEGGFKYIKAYTGPNDVLIGETAGETMGTIKKKLEGEGTQMRTPGGGVLEIQAPAGLAVTIERAEGLETAAKKEGLQILENYEGCSSAEECFETGLQLIPKWKSKLDFIYVTNNQWVPGVIKAAEQSGLQPGKDAWIVTGNCGGPGSVMSSGAVYGTGGQYSAVEGLAAMQMIARYFNSGEKVEPGEEEIKNQTSAPKPDLNQPPKQIALLPNPVLIGAKSLEGEVWGMPITEACPVE